MSLRPFRNTENNLWQIYEVDKNGRKIGDPLDVGDFPSRYKAKGKIKSLKENGGNMVETITSANTNPVEIEDANATEVYRSWDMIVKADVPYGAKSFEDVRAANEATELMERLEHTTAVFYSLFWNIWNDYEIEMGEKVSAWRALFDDFSDAC